MVYQNLKDHKKAIYYFDKSLRCYKLKENHPSTYSNIIDNLIPQNAIKVLTEVKRILKIGGKLLVKLNHFLTEKEIKEWNIKVIEKNFLDDGLFLWNQSTEEWTGLLESYFSIVDYKEIYYPEYDQYNRLFLVINKMNEENI